MTFLLRIYGMFFALPLAMLNILPGGVKIDDIVLFILVVLIPIVIYKKNRYSIISFPYLLFTLVTLIFTLISFYKGIVNADEFIGDTAYTVISRIMQSVLILTFVMLVKKSSFSVQPFFKGYVISASISLIVFFIYFASKVNVASFVSRGVYFTKDIFQYNDDLPFSIHVNTLGSFFLIAFFIIRSNYTRFNLFSYVFLLPSFLLISKGDILAIFIYFGFCFYRRNSLNAFLIIVIFWCAIFLSPLLYDLYMNLAEYRVYTSGRNELYTAAVMSIFDNPLGYGLGMQNNVLLDSTGINFPAHNIFLSIGIELGLPYLSFIIIYIVMWFYMTNESTDKIIFLSFLVIGMFGNAMYFYKYHALSISLCFFGLWCDSQKLYKSGYKINEHSLYTQ